MYTVYNEGSLLGTGDTKLLFACSKNGPNTLSMGQIIEVLRHPSWHIVYSTLHNLRWHHICSVLNITHWPFMEMISNDKSAHATLFETEFYMFNAPLFETIFYKFERVLNCKQQRVTWWLVQILAWHLLSATGVVDEITCYKFQVLQLCSPTDCFWAYFQLWAVPAWSIRAYWRQCVQ